MAANILLANVLDLLWECCRSYYDNKKLEPQKPSCLEFESGSFAMGQLEADLNQNYRMHQIWELNNHAEEDKLESLTSLFTGPAFSVEEKSVITGRLVLLAKYYKDDQVIMRHLADICRCQGLPDLSAVPVG